MIPIPDDTTVSEDDLDDEDFEVESMSADEIESETEE